MTKQNRGLKSIHADDKRTPSAHLRMGFTCAMIAIASYGCRPEITSEVKNTEESSTEANTTPSSTEETSIASTGSDTNTTAASSDSTTTQCTEATFAALDWTVSFTPGYYNSLVSTPAASSICSGSSLLGVTGTASCATGSTTSIQASDVLAGKTYFNNSGTLTTGTLTTEASVDLSAAISLPGAGAYVQSLTGLVRSAVCSTKSFLGVAAGGANCYTGATPPAISITGDFTFDASAYNVARSIVLAATGTAGTATGVTLSFSGDTSMFTLSSASKMIFSHTPASGDLYIPLVVGSSTQDSLTISAAYSSCSSQGQVHTMTVTISDAFGQSTSMNATATCTDPIGGISNLAARFKAEDTSVTSIANAQDICTWSDSSGNGYHATNTAANGTCPKVYTGIWGSGTIPAVRLNGSGSYLDIKTGAGGLSLSRPYSIVMVSKRRGVASGRTFASVTQNWLAGAYTGGVAAFYNGSGWVSTNTAVAVGTRAITVSIDNGTNSSFWLNGVNTTASTHTGVNPGSLSIGRSMYSEWADSDIAEILVFTSALSTGDRQIIETTLGNKY